MLGWLKRRGTAPPAPVANSCGAAELRAEGNAWLDKGDLAKAEDCYRQAVAADTTDPLAVINLAYVLNEQHRHAEARMHARHATALDTNSVDAFYVLANVQVQEADWPAATASLRRVLQLNPAFEPAYGMLCRVLAEQGLLDDARATIQRALALNDCSGEFHFLLGNVELNDGNRESAVASYRRAIALQPGIARFHSNLGMALHGSDALACYREALRLDPGFAVAHANMGIALYEQGDNSAAADSIRQAIALEPERLDFRSKLLFVLSFAEACSPARYRAEAESYGAAASRLATPFSDWPIASARDLGMPLRVGLVSGDLKTHPVGHFLEAAISHLPRHRLELVVYATHPKEDELTARIRPHIALWRSLVGLADEVAARTIRNDGIQVLVDLAGHTAFNRLPVFAWRPAPVQVSWLGYFASTGLRAIDYVLADARCLPPEDEDQFVEKAWRLPEVRYCFTPPSRAPEVTGLPALTAGHLTFGSFQALAKLSETTIDRWAAVLHALPTARCRVQNAHLAQAFERDRLLTRFAARGVMTDRISLHGAVPRQAYLAAHSEVDVLLDTFPYTGGTTTCEALWMGVPTITIEGHTMLTRQGASLMRTLGLDDWVAPDAHSFVDVVLGHVTNLDRLAALRLALRERARASPLYDAPRFAANLAQALHTIAREMSR